MQLTKLQQRFVDYYVEGNNGVISARRAGYKKGAAVRACNLLKRPEIRKEIEDRQLAMRLASGVEKGDLILAALDAHDQAKTVDEKLKAINITANLCGLYPK